MCLAAVLQIYFYQRNINFVYSGEALV